MPEFKQLTSVAQIASLQEAQMNILWKWANRTKYDKPTTGISGMPLLSIGRCIEFSIDHGVPMSALMAGLAIDYHENKDHQLIDLLWECILAVLQMPQLKLAPDGTVIQKIWIKPSELITKGTMQQYIDTMRWKQLTDGEMGRLWAWSMKAKSDTPRLFTNLQDMPMLSIGRLLEFLTDNGMTLKEIFSQCMVYQNKEWSKMQLIDVLWEKVKLVLKLPITQ